MLLTGFLALLVLVVYAALKYNSGKRSVGTVLIIQGPGLFAFDVVGESYYQDALNSIFGPKTEDGIDEECKAILLLDDDNPHDANAVSVSINGKKVGHLSRDLARTFRAQLRKQKLLAPDARFQVSARVLGGWRRGDQDEGMFGVRLDLPPA